MEVAVVVKFQCPRCNYEYTGNDLPSQCPRCRTPFSKFIIEIAEESDKAISKKFRLPSFLNSIIVVLLWFSGFIGGITCLGVIFSDASSTMGYLFLCSFIVFVISALCRKFTTTNEEIEQEDASNKRIRWYNDRLNTFKQNLDVFKENLISHYGVATAKCGLNNNAKLYDSKWYWTHNNSLCSVYVLDVYLDEIDNVNGIYFDEILKGSCADVVDIAIEEIKSKDIKYYKKEGDIQYQTIVSGGGGGGSNIAGAVVGGVLAGEAGAVIGSRNRVEEIKSETVTHDTRQTVFKYFDNGDLKTRIYPLDMFDIFEALIPDKEYNIVIQKEAKISSNSSANDFDIEASLSKLKELYNKGLITEDEFNNKKLDLLNKL